MTLSANQWLEFEIPTPISTNSLYRNVSEGEKRWAAIHYRKLRGRVTTEAYKNWKDLAGWEMLRQLPKPMPQCTGDVYVDVDLPGGLDIDNGLKAIGDLLQRKTGIGIIANDKLIVDYHVRRVHKDNPCIVRVRPVGEWQ